MHSSVIINAMAAALLSPGSPRGSAGQLSAELGCKPCSDARRDEAADVAAEASNLAHDRRGHEQVLLGGSEEKCFDLGIKVSVHARHLEFVLEVRDGAQTAHDHPCIYRMHEVHQ